MYKTLIAPLVVQVEISAKCTNRCVHCYNFWRQDETSSYFPEFSFSVADRVMDQLIHHHVFHMVLTGGEPLLNKKVLFHMLERARNANITVGINSNLVPLTLDDAYRLREFSVSTILTSLMGPRPEIHDEIAQHRGAFDKTVRGIRFLQEARVPVDVNMVISQKNKIFLRDTALFVKSLGLTHFSSTRAGCPGNCNDFSALSLNLKEFRDYLAELYDVGKKEQIHVGVLESYPLCAIREVKRYKIFTGR